MRFYIVVLAVAVGFSMTMSAQSPAWPPSPSHTTLPLWPHAAPGATPNPGQEMDVTTPKDNLVAGKPVIRLGNVSTPTVTLYTPTNTTPAPPLSFFPEAATGVSPSTSKAPKSAIGSTPSASPACC